MVATIDNYTRLRSTAHTYLGLGVDYYEWEHTAYPPFRDEGHAKVAPTDVGLVRRCVGNAEKRRLAMDPKLDTDLLEHRDVSVHILGR